MTVRTRIVDEDASVKATVLDYANSNPLAVRLTDTNGDYVAGSGGGGGDGAIVDGVTASIKATVLDYVASNPLAVRLTDTAGDYVGAGAGTQYTEDAVAAANPTGTMVMAVRADALAAVTTTDGDNIAARATNSGELYVKHVDAIPVTDNGGSLTVDGTVTANAGTGTFVIGDGGGSITVDGSVSVTGAVDTELTTGDLDTGAGTDTRAVVGLVGSASGGGQLIPGSATDGLLVNLGANNDVTVTGGVGINAGTNNIGDVDVLTVPAPLSTTGGGTEATALRVTIASDSTGVVSIDDNGGSLTVDGTVAISGTVTVGSHAVTNAGTFAVQASGDVAHDAVDSGSPIKIGARAETSPKGITLVADGDRTDLLADADGMLLVKIGTANGDLISERVADTGGTSTAFTNFSAVASTRNYVTSIHIYNSSATAGYVDFRDGTAGAVLFTAAAPAGGGMTIASPVPLFKTTANTALAYDVSGALSTVYINVAGYQSKA